jgi:hypothetical protein
MRWDLTAKAKSGFLVDLARLVRDWSGEPV